MPQATEAHQSGPHDDSLKDIFLIKFLPFGSIIICQNLTLCCVDQLCCLYPFLKKIHSAKSLTVISNSKICVCVCVCKLLF